MAITIVIVISGALDSRTVVPTIYQSVLVSLWCDDDIAAPMDIELAIDGW